jgi:tripartite-type tricarboxylate transporter receptor subunit TctC
MGLARRKFLHLTAGVAALAGSSRLCAAEADFPNRPVRLIIGYPAGIQPDVIARIVAPAIGEQLGQPVVVENRPGAGTNLGTEFVVRATADGYTLLLVPVATAAANATLYSKLKFNFIRDIMPVASIGGSPLVLVATPSLPATTIPEFIAYAKSHPGQINMASTGVGTAPDLAGELFNMMAGVKLVNVPYRTNFMQDLVGGQVQVSFPGVLTVAGYITDGKLRTLGVTGAKRSAAYPDIPAIGEFVPGYEVTSWYGIGAPKDTPLAIVDKINAAVAAAIAAPDTKARLAKLGFETRQMKPAEFGRLIADETKKWEKVVNFSGVKMD